MDAALEGTKEEPYTVVWAFTFNSWHDLGPVQSTPPLWSLSFPICNSILHQQCVERIN